MSKIYKIKDLSERVGFYYRIVNIDGDYFDANKPPYYLNGGYEQIFYNSNGKAALKIKFKCIDNRIAAYDYATVKRIELL